MGRHLLELVNAVHALWLLLREHKAAECRLEILATRPVSHAAEARTFPVDLTRLRVEGTLLASLFFQSCGRLRTTKLAGTRRSRSAILCRRLALLRLLR